MILPSSLATNLHAQDEFSAMTQFLFISRNAHRYVHPHLLIEPLGTSLLCNPLRIEREGMERVLFNSKVYNQMDGVVRKWCNHRAYLEYMMFSVTNALIRHLTISQHLTAG